MKIIGTEPFIKKMEDLIRDHHKKIMRWDWELFLTGTVYLSIMEADIVSKETISEKIKIGNKVALITSVCFQHGERWKAGIRRRTAIFSAHDPELIQNIHAWIQRFYTPS